MKKKKLYTLNYTSSVNLIFKKKKFILSALNLAFLAFLSNKKIIYHKDLLMWSDGVFGKKYLKIKKIPGFELISKIRIPKKIKKIVILGNLDSLEREFLTRKFQTKIEHKKVKHANINIIIKNLSLKFNDKNLYIITIPTPKQEQLALHISKKMRNFKIICIGGGLSIASGAVKQSPKIITNLNLEWAWRLRTDTVRRISRLLSTFFVYIFKYLLFSNFILKFKKN